MTNNKVHWTKTPEGREKMSKAIKAYYMRKRQGKKLSQVDMKDMAKQLVKRKYTKSQNKEMTLVINGWRVSLGKDTVRIDHD